MPGAVMVRDGGVLVSHAFRIGCLDPDPVMSAEFSCSPSVQCAL